jgi:hypothetical protein
VERKRRRPKSALSLALSLARSRALLGGFLGGVCAVEEERVRVVAMC